MLCKNEESVTVIQNIDQTTTRATTQEYIRSWNQKSMTTNKNMKSTAQWAPNHAILETVHMWP